MKKKSLKNDDHIIYDYQAQKYDEMFQVVFPKFHSSHDSNLRLRNFHIINKRKILAYKSNKNDLF